MKSSARVLVCLCLWAATARVEAQDVPDVAAVASEPGREASLRARVLFDAGDYRGAALEYTSALDDLPRGPRRSAVLNNLAVCYERLLAYDDALATYERYLREADPTPEDRAEVERIVRGLRERLAQLSISSDVAASVWIDEREVGATPLTVWVTAGAHVVELRAPGRLNTRRNVSLRARSLEELHVPLVRAEHYRGAHRAYVYSGIGLTAASLVLGAGLGIRALRLHGAGEDLSKNDLATVEEEAHIRRVSLAATVSFGAGALFGASSLVLAFLTDWRPAKVDGTRVGVAPLARGEGALLLVGGVL